MVTINPLGKLASGKLQEAIKGEPGQTAPRTSKILTAERKFCSDDIMAVARDPACVLRVKGYYSAEMCVKIVDGAIASPLYGPYINAPEIGRWGQAYFESQASEESRRRYEESSVALLASMRALCWPYLSPIDQFRLELDEAWTPGARILTLGKLKMFAGLLRRFGKGAQAEPHQDVLAWDAPDSPEAAGLTCQLAVNIYLTAAKKGGELVLFGVARSRQEYERDRVPNSYGVRRETLPDPIAILQPEVGELIIFRADYMHAVLPIEDGDRWSCACFVAFRSAAELLGVWS